MVKMLNHPLLMTGAKITKLNGEHCHISSMLATKGLLWLGTSLGITLVYRIPCLEGVPLISGRPYLAYDAHQDSVRVLLSMNVTLRPIRQRIGSRVLRDHIRKMNRPISSAAIIEEEYLSRDTSASPISDLSTSGNVTSSYKTDEVFTDDLSKENRDRIAKEVIEDLTSHDAVESRRNHRNKYHEYETLNWIGPDQDGSSPLLELTATQEGISQNYVVPPTEDERKDSGDYETVEYPEDGHAVDILYTRMHPRHYSMTIPGKDDTITPPTEEVQLVLTAGRGLTHFRKLRSRTVYHKSKPTTTPMKTSQDGHVIVYELDSTHRMFNPEDSVG